MLEVYNDTKKLDYEPLIETTYSADESSNEEKPNLIWFYSKLSVLLVAVFLLGILKALPLAILIPESISIGLSISQATLIISAWSASGVCALLVQPLCNRLPDAVYLLSSGIVCASGFFSFHFSVKTPDLYLYIATTAFLLSGTAHTLIKNKISVYLTSHFEGNVGRTVVLYEIFISIGFFFGAYLGSFIDSHLGFVKTMLVGGAIVIVVIASLMLFLFSQNNISKDKKHDLSFPAYSLLLDKDVFVFFWCPAICMAACIVSVEGVLTEFYKQDYGKTLGFGGVILYSLTAVLVGVLREYRPKLVGSGLPFGLIVAGIGLLLLGPYLHIPSIPDLYLSVGTFNLLLICSCMVQINAGTIAASVIAGKTSSETATILVMNANGVAYNFGAFIGPIFIGNLLEKLSFAEAFGVGAPFLILTGSIAAVRFFQKNY